MMKYDPMAVEAAQPGAKNLRDFYIVQDALGAQELVWVSTDIERPDDALISAYDPRGALITERASINNAAYNAATVALTADYPQLEKDTWPTQNEEASAWVADPVSASTPWIDRAASERGIDREEYIRRTLVKAEQFKILSAFLTGRRQRYEDQIKAGSDPVLDYELTPEVQTALYQASQTIMTTAASDLQGALA